MATGTVRAMTPISWRTDLTIRAIGIVQLAIAATAIRAPARSAGLSTAHQAIGMALAAIGFLAGSAGAAALFVGGGLLAPIAVSARWRRQAERQAGRRAEAAARENGATENGATENGGGARDRMPAIPDWRLPR